MPDIFVDTPTTDPITLTDQPIPEKKEEELPPLPPLSTPPKPLVTEHHIHSLSDFCRDPKNAHFQNQDNNEKILVLLRRHFATNIPWIVATFFLLMIPPLLTTSLPFLFANTPFVLLPQNFITMLLAFYYLILLGFFFVNFITWFYNVSLVTDTRIIDIDFKDIVYHNIAATKISLIEDVDYTQAGLGASFFNYGDVAVQTAATVSLFDFNAVPQPSLVTGMIEKLIGKGPQE